MVHRKINVEQQFGTAGFVMQQGNNGEDRMVGAHVTPGPPDKINAYRSKLGRILAIVIVTEAIAKLHDIQEGKIKVGCDCESGIIAIFENTYATPKQPHPDLIHEIRKKLALSRLKWIPRHVDGHQDKHTSYLRLDMWGQLNVEMDSLAITYWNETFDKIQPFYPQSNRGWSLWIQERKLSSWNRTELYKHAKSTTILQHWSQRRTIPQQLIRSIDWEAGQNAIRQLGLN
jgi:hypothetical protein